ncbi:PREDICTED: alpha-N-acetyl-neuraminyl-2,3-beta-galactosyl-1,3-N-acetyl-galactosaminide alpha-2,6-sialyltransferase isoform X1 [Cyprinodon variegatus]|uniref:ST6 N-acetylgalactosaminide alpha-2,6-sialyltransferase 4 n=2 Tax=Cyprinodon variegatus TaxID=28743 RepID=A0A3Q2D4D2_CYPVA|nr:PREDICTED: alpha-N-acetyl-neuraminyl-2,3-beta-galactosyl-1,3-N-acetyl-galactosaminide alpha-2,6-sialyltransferase isoform X1 [Cyprinodon variegatus]
MSSVGSRTREAAFIHKLLLNLRPKQKFRRWVCLLSLTLLLLLWFGSLITPSNPSSGSRLRGYRRIRPGRMGQFLDIHCNRCALVSSSGQMLGARAGNEIDQTECVIRMNNAPTRGFEKDVGSRTNIRVVSHTTVPLLVKKEWYYFKQSADTTYVFWGPERNMRQDGEGIIFNNLLKLAIKYPKVKMYVMTREKILYCDNMFQNETGKNRMKTGAYLSTGFFTMILAMEMCDSIDVYGMIEDNYCSQANRSVVPYHYYDQKRISECRMYTYHEHKPLGGHRFITEKAIYAKWARRNKIQFKYPAWRLHRGLDTLHEEWQPV